MSSVIGALPHHRTEIRTGLHNGHRSNAVSTVAGICNSKCRRPPR